jgi:signal transduction histidine kinase
LSKVADGLTEALEDLQELSRGIHPAILSKGGLAPALRALAHRSSIPVNLDLTAKMRVAEPIEVAAYFVASEALANAKHSRASRIDVRWPSVTTGCCCRCGTTASAAPDPTRESSLVALTDRVEALGTSIGFDSRPGSGTKVTAEFPLD